MTATTARELNSVVQLLESLKKTVRFTDGLVLTTVPRGGLQIAQPANAPEDLLKSYSKGFHASDKMSWQAILKHKPVRPLDVYSREEYASTPYFQELLQPQDLKYAVALPLAAPVLEGYPGVVHVLRSEDEGDFTAAEVHQLMSAIAHFDQSREKARQRHRGSATPGRLEEQMPASHVCIVDSKLRPHYGGPAFNALDNRLKQQVMEHAKRRMHQLNGHGFLGDRLQIADSHGDMWIFRLVTYKHYPALGEGPFAFFCLQPDVQDWGAVKPQDFHADEELARLIPALKFMQENFSRGPTLVEIAKMVHLSPFHFHRRFTELLGLTPKQFLLDCQIHQAKSDLLARDKELATIAKECGFAHQSHFTSRFKQATGLTPTRWRRMVARRQEESAN